MNPDGSVLIPARIQANEKFFRALFTVTEHFGGLASTGQLGV
jgi:hypothetical protein